MSEPTGRRADWHDFGPSRPLEVEGGVKARSKRGSIGERWWSRRFIDVLESFGLSTRLSRAEIPAWP